MSKQTVLIVEDEERIRHWVSTYFERAGYQVLATGDGAQGLQWALATPLPDLVILDLMLPGMDGLEICQTLRREKLDVPIIMLTARGKESDRIVGLDQGADDYIVKPFSPGELLARARAVLRRTRLARQAADGLRRGEVFLDFVTHHCLVKDRLVELTSAQFAILEALMQRPGQVLSRQQLLEAAFEGDYAGFDRSLDAHIRRLRQRLELDPAQPRYVVTVFGVGYKFVE